jgi:hypothetical protein
MFRRENDFIKSLLDNTGIVYSTIECLDNIPITPKLLLTKRFESEYLNSKYHLGNIDHIEGIFKNPAGIFLYLSKQDGDTIYKIKIIYDVTQYDEVILFIKQLTKLK